MTSAVKFQPTFYVGTVCHKGISGNDPFPPVVWMSVKMATFIYVSSVDVSYLHVYIYMCTLESTSCSDLYLELGNCAYWLNCDINP